MRRFIDWILLCLPGIHRLKSVGYPPELRCEICGADPTERSFPT